jgi:cyclic pyranopterin phosphate synthase
LASVFLGLGVRTIRLTGGEPLVRAGVAGLVGRLAALRPRLELSLTTNAIALADKAEELARSGLDRVNVSLDTLDRAKFHTLTRRDRLDDVLAGLAAAQAAGLSPVKVNAVLMREQNLSEAPELLAWALRAGYQLRFIEHMPLDAEHLWTMADMVTADEVLDVLGQSFRLRPVGHRGHAPAEDFEVLDGPGRPDWAPAADGGHRVGIIASVTRPFCRDCDRLRLTADGQLRTCLFGHAETDLRGALRDGATDAELAELISQAVRAKPAGHGINAPGFRQPERPMSAIGG